MYTHIRMYIYIYICIYTYAERRRRAHPRHEAVDVVLQEPEARAYDMYVMV